MIVAGIDVGGARKGFHAVALRGAEIVAKTRSASAREMAAWCREAGAGNIEALGDARDGMIFVPREPLAARRI